jgi:hypothetical protein
MKTTKLILLIQINDRQKKKEKLNQLLRKTLKTH